MSPINTDSRFLTKDIAFRQGVNDALKAPVLILIAGMIGFGAAGKNYDIDIFFYNPNNFFYICITWPTCFIRDGSLRRFPYIHSISCDTYINSVHHNDRNSLSTI